MEHIPSKLTHTLCCESITALDVSVVPDVKSRMVISSALIGASKNARFPAERNFLPFSRNGQKEWTDFVSLTSSMQIKCFTEGISFLISSTIDCLADE